MILINRTNNCECTMLRMAGSFRMVQEDWTKRSNKKGELKNHKSIHLKLKSNE